MISNESVFLPSIRIAWAAKRRPVTRQRRQARRCIRADCTFSPGLKIDLAVHDRAPFDRHLGHEKPAAPEGIPLAVPEGVFFLFQP
ncbi:hypothetical protein SDC9_183232 [bioreactor metagenome]|uniref:Uncharacterized protein n=1 Tax=bioreactor metagenome TaxID=1076179 RepID=A0A645HJA9_9ZZZZ